MNDTSPAKPWYKQFWPWFLIALPATGVIAGITTVIIAVNNPPQMTQSNIGKFARVVEQPSAEANKPDELARESSE